MLRSSSFNFSISIDSCGLIADRGSFQAVLEPPYSVGHERPTLDDSGELTDEGRRVIDQSGWAGIGRNPATRRNPDGGRPKL